MDDWRYLVDVPGMEEITPQRYDEVVAAAAPRWRSETKRELGQVLQPHIGNVAEHDTSKLSTSPSPYSCAADAAETGGDPTAVSALCGILMCWDTRVSAHEQGWKRRGRQLYGCGALRHCHVAQQRQKLELV
ncbi:hypothetical protein C8Q80DRAFT_267235 [Daedaleopsis nitida]|nr:hypothetical protein C8Q80DRAFT_267235 [Daedaleopsis nitida]